jgi:outer membrane murein-binding lipoprotein Lpp
MLGSVRQLLVAVAAVAILGGPAAAVAQDMSASDVSRLEQTVDQINSDLVQLRQRDRAAARSLQAELLTLDEEVTYLKVKLRRERNVSRADYMDVRDRLENLSARVNGRDTSAGGYTTGTASPGYPASGQRSTTGSQAGVVPMGTELDVRLEQSLNSDTAQVEDRFEATTVVDLRENNRVVIPAGSRVRGVVTAVKNAGRVERKGELQLSFDQITVNGRNLPIRGTVTQALEAGGYRDDAEKIGAGAAVGAILGGILGGVKGAITGILIGGGGVVAATEGEDVNLPSGTILRMRLDQDVNVGRVTRQ